MLKRRTQSNSSARAVQCTPTGDRLTLWQPQSCSLKNPVMVGRHASNSITLDHPELPLLISRYHAKFLFEDGRVILQDLKATNGTYVNEQKLPCGARATLQDGDVVSFGGPGSIMKDGQPFCNPFIYTFSGDATGDLADVADDEEALVEAEDSGSHLPGSEEERSLPPVRAWASPGPSRLARVVTRDDIGRGEDGEERGSPMVCEQMQLPRQQRRSNRLSIQEQMHPRDDPSEGADGATAMSPCGSPRCRPPDEMDCNPSPSKRSRLQRGTAGGACGRPASQLEGQENRPKTPDSLRSSGGRQVFQVLENQLECSICQEMMIAPHSVVPCGHMFCGDCLHQLLKTGRQGLTCPQCRSVLTAPPVKCLRVENILLEVVERTQSPTSRGDRAARRRQWEKVSKSSAAEWARHFSHGEARRGPERVPDPARALSDGRSNFSLNMMLDNLRQVRETLRSVTTPDEGGQAEGTASTVYVVEYARSNRSRCSTCHEVLPLSWARSNKSVHLFLSVAISYAASVCRRFQ